MKASIGFQRARRHAPDRKVTGEVVSPHEEPPHVVFRLESPVNKVSTAETYEYTHVLAQFPLSVITPVRLVSCNDPLVHVPNAPELPVNAQKLRISNHFHDIVAPEQLPFACPTSATEITTATCAYKFFINNLHTVLEKLVA